VMVAKKSAKVNPTPDAAATTTMYHVTPAQGAGHAEAGRGCEGHREKSSGGPADNRRQSHRPGPGADAPHDDAAIGQTEEKQDDADRSVPGPAESCPVQEGHDGQQRQRRAHGPTAPVRTMRAARPSHVARTDSMLDETAMPRAIVELDVSVLHPVRNSH
jgi:hypothetical protein